MNSYYRPEDLARFPEVAEGAPALWEKFQAWYAEALKDGALTAREKALIALAVAQTLQCPYCIDAYSRACLENGSDLDQMTEALHVAAALRAGATLVHGVQMKAVVDRLSL
ncbi:MAG TPA: arsenosugar biosynthesis-associated peroxidase-like protein [Isosphaeraceae bacterium]|jgi:alkylhydroperoxidase/carboxymuconolactone decarboxylase family protein|nr:arsenosugar biosynthesis-associated peroxidase-like protein [Isosphaeraceae bacterium]